jgi:hypothetical protein
MENWSNRTRKNSQLYPGTYVWQDCKKRCLHTGYPGIHWCINSLLLILLVRIVTSSGAGIPEYEYNGIRRLVPGYSSYPCPRVLIHEIRMTRVLQFSIMIFENMNEKKKNVVCLCAFRVPLVPEYEATPDHQPRHCVPVNNEITNRMHVI